MNSVIREFMETNVARNIVSALSDFTLVNADTIAEYALDVNSLELFDEAIRTNKRQLFEYILTETSQGIDILVDVFVRVFEETNGQVDISYFDRIILHRTTRDLRTAFIYFERNSLFRLRFIIVLTTTDNPDQEWSNLVSVVKVAVRYDTIEIFNSTITYIKSQFNWREIELDMGEVNTETPFNVVLTSRKLTFMFILLTKFSYVPCTYQLDYIENEIRYDLNQLFMQVVASYPLVEQRASIREDLLREFREFLRTNGGNIMFNLDNEDIYAISKVDLHNKFTYRNVKLDDDLNIYLKLNNTTVIDILSVRRLLTRKRLYAFKIINRHSLFDVDMQENNAYNELAFYTLI